jgi:hypothetical protein
MDVGIRLFEKEAAKEGLGNIGMTKSGRMVSLTLFSWKEKWL